MENLTLLFSIICCGRPKSGKSHFIKYLLYLFTSKKNIYERFTYGIVFNKTSFNKSYNYIPSQWVFNAYNPEALMNLMNVQKSILVKGYSPPHAFVVFDV